MSDWIGITCPYCWGRFDHWADAPQGDHQYVEDCRICCHPILLTVTVNCDGKVLAINVKRENE